MGRIIICTLPITNSTVPAVVVSGEKNRIEPTRNQTAMRMSLTMLATS